MIRDGTDGNLDLSRRRAQAVKAVLEKWFGITPSRLRVEGKGAAHWLVPTTSGLTAPC